MAMTHTDITDALTLVGLLGFPAYLIYWVGYHLKGERWRRLWLLPPAFVAWCLATYYCFLRLVLMCVGGCGDRVSPFLELAILYAISSVLLVALMHWNRATRAPELPE